MKPEVELAHSITPASRGAHHWIVATDAFVERRIRWIYAATAGLLLIPIWTFAYFPSLDGPVHLAIADIAARYEQADTLIFREFYELNWRPIPNLFIYLILVPLVEMVSPLAAEKILLSIYVVGFLTSAFYAVRGIDKASSVLGLLTAPFVYNFLLHLGFYNFCFGLSFFLLTFGFWTRHRNQTTVAVFLGYVGLSAATYFTHIFAWAAVAVTIGIIATVELVWPRPGDRAARSPGLDWRRYWRGALLPGLAFMPVAVLALSFFVADRTGSVSDIPTDYVYPLGERLLRLAAVGTALALNYDAASHTPWFVFGLFVLFALQVSRGKAPSSFVYGTGIACLAFLALYLFAPYKFVMRWIPMRVEPYFWLLLILWLAGFYRFAKSSRKPMIRVFALTLSVLIGAPTMYINMKNYATLNRYIAEYVAAGEHMAPGSVVLAARLSAFPENTEPLAQSGIFFQTMGYLSFMRTVVDLDAYQAASEVFPVKYRDHLNPYHYLAPDAVFVGAPHLIDIAPYERRIGRPIDYILLWGDTDALRELQPSSPLVRTLREEFTRIYRSSPSGFANLYARRG